MAGLLGRIAQGATHFLGADTPEGANRLALISSALKDVGSNGQTDALGEFMKTRKALATQEAILAQAQRAGASPMEMAFIRMNPSKAADNYTTAFAGLRGYHDVDGGHTALFGNPNAGGTTYTADKLVDHDGAYGTQGRGGYVSTGQAAPSNKEAQDALNAANSDKRADLELPAKIGLLDAQAAAARAPKYETTAPGAVSTLVYDPNAPRPAAAGVQAPTPALPAAETVAAMVKRLMPGAQISSGFRTPGHNAEVGGVANSMHTRGQGQAVDIVPPAGTTAEALRKMFEDQGVHPTELLNEGDHVHVGWGQKGAPAHEGPPATIRGGAPAATVPSGYRATPTGGLEFIPGGPADPAVSSNAKNLRPLPAGVITSVTGNRQALINIDRAIAAISKNPDALGAANYIPAPVRDRMSSHGANDGIDARAVVSQIGSQKIHDLSGAAVTASEFPRLRPFIPLATDRADVAVKKLNNMKLEYESLIEQAQQAYGPESGYRQLADHSATARPTAPRVPAVGTVEDGHRFLGGDPANPASWTKVH